MRGKLLFLSSMVAASIVFVGCGSSSTDYEVPNNPPVENPDNPPAPPQEGVKSYLFYGEADHKTMGTIKNLRVFDPDNPTKALIETDDTNAKDSVITTKMNFNAKDNSYSGLQVETISYVSDKKAYVVPMTKGEDAPKAIRCSTLDNITSASYENIDYLGTKTYIIAESGDKTYLITPDMRESDSAIEFGDKSLIGVTYETYGAPIDGYLVYDNEKSEVQKCSLSMDCQKIDFGVDVGSRDFEGDILGTTYSVFVVGDSVYRVDKSDGSVTSVSLGGQSILVGHGTTDVGGDSFYFIGKDYNIYRANMKTLALSKVTPKADERVERIRSFTNDYLIYGSDILLMAAKKDGSSTEPIVLSENTKTSGYKYVTNYGFGDNFLYVTYSINKDTADTTYRACVFDGNAPKCKENSFWAGATVKKDGVRNFDSKFTYTPYVLIRVDNTDNFGGGTLKAINPDNPFGEGVAMGSVANYNFQTFISNSDYLEGAIDSDGGVVFYAKNDSNYHVDAFYFNVNKAGSLVQLTNTNPHPDVTSGRDHCYGRNCMICHNFGGGKIWTSEDYTEAKSAYGYKIELEFEDGHSVLADVAKGKGENFSIPLKKMLGNFKAKVLDENGTVVNKSAGYYHEGVESANCNYCHARYGKMLYDAPGLISIK
jgi:hypothetical protein